MKKQISCKLALSMCVGGVCGVAGASEPATALDISSVRVLDVAHIYYSISSGERVITLIGDHQTVGADSGEPGSASIWANTSNACANVEPGVNTAFFYVADDNSGTTSLATNVTTVDWADISVDSVVDCVRIEWVTRHEDVDADSDGIGDGVEGLAAQWTYWDGENGRAIDGSTRTPLISFVFTDLPGYTLPDLDLAAGYTVDIDLASTQSSSLVFEICDTDSDLQGAAVHNAGIGNMDRNFDGLPDSDLDGDGLADWAWSVRFFQPGTADLDSDGFLDGDIADSMQPIGMSPAAPEGNATDNGDGTWSFVIDTAPSDAGTGSDDAFAIYDANGDHAGVFWFDGFTCEPGDDGFVRPYASFFAQLFGPIGEAICRADLTEDGELNFFDVSLFLSQFTAGGDYNNDGETNFFDVSAFLADFSDGCP